MNKLHNDESLLIFPKFPFITGYYPSRNQADIPEFLPFYLGFCVEQGLVFQKASAEVDKALKAVYERGSLLSTPIGEGNINRPLFEEIIEFIAVACGGISGKSFFEPGCGKGGLLKALRNRGAKRVEGCEPGPQGQLGKVAHGVEIHNEFFAFPNYSHDFNCVYHYGVLEHIKEPESFLRQNLEILSPGGLLFASVPGCKMDFELGNFMALAHEHYSYFTADSLIHLMRKAGLQNVEVREFKFSRGILCAWGNKASGDHPRQDPSTPKEHCRKEQDLLEVFVATSKRNLSALQARVDAREREKKTIGFYGAPRALAGLLEFKFPPRHFDGDTLKNGCYFSGSPNPIEPPENLIKDPVDELWVLPIYHDRAIRDYLKRKVLPYSHISIYSLLDMMQDSRTVS